MLKMKGFWCIHIFVLFCFVYGTMVLTLDTFKEFVSSFRTHKENVVDSNRTHEILSAEDLSSLEKKFGGVLDATFVQQAVTVRHGVAPHVEELLENHIAFRRANDWPLQRIEENSIHEGVLASLAHTISTTDDEFNRPSEGLVDEQAGSKQTRLVMFCGRIDMAVASVKEFQKHALFMLEQLTADKHVVHEQGIALQLDFKGASFGILRKMSTDDLNRGIGIYRNYPVKVKTVFVTNASFSARLAMKAVSLVASKKVRSKVVFL